MVLPIWQDKREKTCDQIFLIGRHFECIKFLHMFLLIQLMATNLEHLIKSFICANFLYRKIIVCIWLKNYITIDLLRTYFHEHLSTHFFLEQRDLLPLNQK